MVKTFLALFIFVSFTLAQTQVETQNGTFITLGTGANQDTAQQASKFLKNADSTTLKAGLLKNADSTTLKAGLLKNADSTTIRNYDNNLYASLSAVLKNADSTTLKAGLLKNADSTSERTYSNNKYASLSAVLKNADSTTLKAGLLKNADSTTIRNYDNNLYSPIAGSSSITTIGAVTAGSLTTSSLCSLTGNSGTATIGSGDSVQVSVTNLTTSAIVSVAYNVKGFAGSDTAVSWFSTAAGKFTIFGKYNKKVSWVVMSK